MQTKFIIGFASVLACSILVYVLALAANQPVAKPLFFDNFEYDVARSATNAEVAFRMHGWSDVKANNSHFRRGAGYLYTKFDPIRKSRVLVMESLPSTAPIPEGFRSGQTDYWLKIGGLPDSPLTTIPANVWFQFWTYATTDSRFYRQKFLYPSRGSYPASRRDGRTDYMWLLGFRGEGETPRENPTSSRILAFEAWHADFRGDREYPTNRQKLFQNLAPKTALLAGRWYQVRIHIDVSGEQGVYEAWIREAGCPWTKVAEWIGGVTKDFSWPIPANERVGFRVLAMPTTVNGPGDSTTYIDDFAMATSERDLP